MLCPYQGCGGKTKVLKTWHEDGNVVRKRGCKKCSNVFSTCEKRAVKGRVEPNRVSSWATCSP